MIDDDGARYLSHSRENFSNIVLSVRPLTMAFPFARPPTNDPRTYRSPTANSPKKAAASRRRLEDEATRGEPPADTTRGS
jgi:hypothetical protein